MWRFAFAFYHRLDNAATNLHMIVFRKNSAVVILRSAGENFSPFQYSVALHASYPALPQAEPCRPSNIAGRPRTLLNLMVWTTSSKTFANFPSESEAKTWVSQPPLPQAQVELSPQTK